MITKSRKRAPNSEKQELEFKIVSAWFRSGQYEDEKIRLAELPDDEIREAYKSLEQEALACAKTGNFGPIAQLLSETGPFGSRVLKLRDGLSPDAWNLIVEKLEGKTGVGPGRQRLSAEQKRASTTSYAAADNVPMLEFLIKTHRGKGPTDPCYGEDVHGVACDYAARLSGDRNLRGETVRDLIRKRRR